MAAWNLACHAIIDKPPNSNVSMIVPVIFWSQHAILISKIKWNTFAFRIVVRILLHSCFLFHSKCNVYYYLEKKTGTANLLANGLGSLSHQSYLWHIIRLPFCVRILVTATRPSCKSIPTYWQTGKCNQIVIIVALSICSTGSRFT
jgi:hypothetical protein